MLISLIDCPTGALCLRGGEDVVTCLSCFDSLHSQFREFEKIKVSALHVSIGRIDARTVLWRRVLWLRLSYANVVCISHSQVREYERSECGEALAKSAFARIYLN